jgi:hypothetical protein
MKPAHQLSNQHPTRMVGQQQSQANSKRKLSEACNDGTSQSPLKHRKNGAYSAQSCRNNATSYNIPPSISSQERSISRRSLLPSFTPEVQARLNRGRVQRDRSTTQGQSIPRSPFRRQLPPTSRPITPLVEEMERGLRDGDSRSCSRETSLDANNIFASIVCI